MTTAPTQNTIDLVKRLEAWLDEFPVISIARRQAFNALLDEVRLGCLPPSKHPLIYIGDLDLFENLFSASARRIRNELNRMQTLLEMRDE